MQRSFRQLGQNAKEAGQLINYSQAIAGQNANAIPNAYFRFEQNQFVPYGNQPSFFRDEVGQNCQDDVIL